MRKVRHMLGISGALLGLGACGGAKPSTSQLDLTNAISIEADEYPAVVMLFRPDADGGVYCTGVFVNDHQALTAAHCLGDAASSEVYFVQPQDDGNGSKTVAPQARAIRTHVHENFDPSLREAINRFDLAVVDFPGGTAPGTIKLSRSSPRLKDKVTLVGFGGEVTEKNGIQGASTIGDKRYGSNTIASASEGMLALSGLARSRQSFPLGQHVASAQGDSGSPWIVDGQLASITVGGEIKEKGQGQELSYTYAIDLNSDTSRQFLDAILD